MSIKKFGKYLLIVLLLLIGLCAVGCLYLFFVPNSSLFGITYISYSDTYSSKGVTYNSETTRFSTVQVNSRAYKVQVVTGSSDEISVEVYSNSLGFTLTKNSTVSITSNITSDNVLVFDITEPHGATSLGTSYVKLRIPENISININLTNKSASTTIDSANLTVGTLYYSTERGDLKIGACSISGTLDLELNKGDCTLTSDAVLTNNEVLLELTSGSFDSTACTVGNITINKNSNGVIKVGTCGELVENIKSAGGRIEVKTLSLGNIITSDSNVYIDTVTDGLNVWLTKSGSVEVTNANCICVLQTNDGHILVQNATSTLTLISEDGDITANNATARVVANTDYGTVTINFSSEAESYSQGNASRSLSSTIKSGKLIASGVENVDITVTDNGRVELTMNDVLGSNIITGARGDIFVVVSDSSVFNLTTRSDSGNVSIKTSDIWEVNDRTEQTSYIHSTASSSNTFTITTTSGDLKVRDETFINW